MEKVITKKKDINSLADLRLYQKQLRISYTLQQNQLKGNLKSEITNFPSRLFSRKNKLPIDNGGKIQLPPTKKLVSRASGWLVKTVLPKKTGFITRWLVGLAVKKTVNKVIEKIPAGKHKIVQNATLPTGNTMIRRERDGRLF